MKFRANAESDVMTYWRALSDVKLLAHSNQMDLEMHSSKLNFIYGQFAFVQQIRKFWLLQLIVELQADVETEQTLTNWLTDWLTD